MILSIVDAPDSVALERDLDLRVVLPTASALNFKITCLRSTQVARRVVGTDADGRPYTYVVLESVTEHVTFPVTVSNTLP